MYVVEINFDNDDIGGLDFGLLCVKSSSFTVNRDRFKKYLSSKKIFKVFYFDFLLRALGRLATRQLNSFPASLLAYSKLIC